MTRSLELDEESGYICEEECDISVGGHLKVLYVSDTFYIEVYSQYIVRNIDDNTMLNILGYEELEMNIRNENTCKFMLDKFNIELPKETTPPIIGVGESYLWIDLSKGILSPKLVTKVI